MPKVYTVLHDLDSEGRPCHFRRQAEAFDAARRYSKESDSMVEIMECGTAPLSVGLLVDLLNGKGGWAANERTIAIAENGKLRKVEGALS